MDFIERMFGISPDGGNGALEMSLLLVVAAIPLVIVLRRRLLSPFQRLWERAMRTRA